MARMKTFFIYFLLIVLFFIYSQIMIYIGIRTTYKDKDVNIEQIFNKGFSGKENHTGLGLWEIRQILKKNNNANLHTTKNDKYFSQQLEIYY